MGPMRDVLKLGTDVAGEDGHDVGLLGRQLFPNQPEWLAFGNPLTKIADGGASTIIGTLGDPAPDLKTRMAHKWVVVACDTSSDGRVVAALVRYVTLCRKLPLRLASSSQLTAKVAQSLAGRPLHSGREPPSASSWSFATRGPGPPTARCFSAMRQRYRASRSRSRATGSWA